MKASAKVLMCAALLVGTATACSDLTGVNARADGVYYLQTVSSANGTSTVPYTYVDQTTGNRVTVQSDVYSLNSDGTYSELATYRVFNGTTTTNQSQNESGNWTQSTNVVTFTPRVSSTNNFALYQGSIGSSSSFGGVRTLSITINGTTALYSE
jgi:hypothetical protein